MADIDVEIMGTGKTLSFPDSMSPDQIKQVLDTHPLVKQLRQQAGQAAATTAGLSAMQAGQTTMGVMGDMMAQPSPSAGVAGMQAAQIGAAVPQGYNGPIMRAANAGDKPLPNQPDWSKVPINQATRSATYDPTDPLGYAHFHAQQQAMQPGFMNQAIGKAREYLASAVDPRMLALAVGTAGAGAVASPALQPVVQGGRAALGTVFGTQMAADALNEAKQGRWGGATVAGLGSLGAFAGAAHELTGETGAFVPEGGNNAVQVNQAGEVLQRQPQEAGGAGGGRGRVEQGVKGKEVTPQGQGQKEGQITPPEQVPTGTGTQQIITSSLGRAQQTAQAIAGKLGVSEVQDGGPLILKAGELENNPKFPSAKAHDVLSEYVKNKPDEPLPGSNATNGVPGESFNQFQQRMAQTIVPLVNDLKPGETLAVVRHGDTAINKEGLLRGSTDVPLNENGMKQAQAAADMLSQTQPEKVLVGHFRTDKYIDAWLKNGMPADGSIDVDEFLRDGHPTGSIMYLTKNADGSVSWVKDPTLASVVPSEAPGHKVTEVETGRAIPSEKPAGSPGGDYFTAARKSVTTPERIQAGMDPVEMQAYKTYGESYLRGKQAVIDGSIDPRATARDIVDKVRAPEPHETGALLYDRVRLNNALREGYAVADDALARGDMAANREAKSNIADILEARDLNDQALRKGGREASAALQAFQMAAKDDYSLGTVMQKARVKYDGQIPEEVASQVRDLQSKLEQAQTRLDQYAQEMRKPREATNPRTREFGEANTVFTKERADAARQRIQSKIGQLSAGVDPELIKDLVELGGYYVEGGIRSFAGWAKQMKADVPGVKDDHLQAAWSQLTNDKRLAQAKARLEKTAAGLEERLSSGNLQPIKPPKIEYDAGYLKRYNEVNSIRNRLNDAIEAERPKTLLEKANALHREFILSGYSVFSKLFGATAWNIPVETLADTFGSAIGRAAKIGGKPLRDVAGREGEMSFAAAKAHLEGLMSKEALNNAVQVAKTGVNDIFQTAGYKAKKAELGGYLGRIHGFEKSFLQTAEFKKSLYMRLAKMSRLGKDPTTPEAQFEAAMGAANDAISQILQSDNKGSQFINTIVAAAGRVHPVAGAVARTLVPITRVPANYLGRAIQMTGLGIPEGIVRHINASIKAGKGIDISPQEADAIGRAYKYGGVGLVAMYLGLNQPDWFKTSGYYQGPGKPGNPDTDGKPMPPGTLQIGGVHVPHLIAHSPFVEAVQFWASVRHASEVGAPRFQTAITGLAEQAPGALGINMMQAAGERGGVEGALGEYGRSLVEPQLIQQIAKEQDKPAGTPWYDMFVQGQKAQYRHPKGAVQELQYGLPETPLNPQFNRLTLPTSGKKAKPLFPLEDFKKQTPKFTPNFGR